MHKYFCFLFYMIISFFQIFSQHAFRDPFYLQEQSNKEILKLSGLLKTKHRFSAILEKKGESKIVFKGDVVWGYLIKEIGENFIVLKKGEKSFRLTS
ncbi:MAG: hypothetical protein WC436_04030 [Candidatus Babeliales bacterium]